MSVIRTAPPSPEAIAAAKANLNPDAPRRRVFTASEITIRVRSRRGREPIPPPPPYEVPGADADLLRCGVNFGTIAPEMATCKRCGLAFLPLRYFSARGIKGARREVCDPCIRPENHCL